MPIVVYSKYCGRRCVFFFGSISIFFFFFALFHFPASGQAVVTGSIPSPPRFLPSIFIAHRVQQSHCSSVVHRVLLTHALALSASQFVHKKKSQRIYTSTHSAGLELTKLTYTRLEDNLIRHRGDRLIIYDSRTTLLALLPSSSNSAPGSHSGGPFSPSPLRHVPSFFSREQFSVSSPVDSRRIVYHDHRGSQQLVPFFWWVCATWSV